MEDEIYEKILERAEQSYIKHNRGYKGQLLTYQDSLDWWIYNETVNYFKEKWITGLK